jgi:hypothetical protein
MLHNNICLIKPNDNIIIPKNILLVSFFIFSKHNPTIALHLLKILYLIHFL